MRFLAVLIFCFASIPWAAEATSPCVGDGCIDEASANFVAPYDVFETRCVQVDPEDAKRYREMKRAAFANEDPEFLNRLRASEIYSKVRKELQLKADKVKKKDMVADCKKSLMDR